MAGIVTAPGRGERSRWRVLGGIGMLAGAWLLAAPFVLGYPHHYPREPALANDLVIGVLVLTLSAAHTGRWQTNRWASRGVLVLGLWLLLAPGVLGYWHRLMVAVASDMITGAVVVAGALLSLAASTDD